MKIASKDYIINTVFRTNILPIISECNTSCIFCSHKQNPHGIEVYRLPKMDAGDFNEIIDYLSPHRKIVIGESATRIVEGEPLLHRDFLSIAALIRERYPKTPIQVTTNGIGISEALVEKLVDLRDVELNISLNCVNPFKRAKILGRSSDDNIAAKVGLLKNKLKFSGSFVYLPDLLDVDDIEEMISLLSENCAETIRVFLPGYTNKANCSSDLRSLYAYVENIMETMRLKYPIPIIVEPSFISTLDCSIEGVIRGTPAYREGLKRGDIITKVNGDGVRTRVEGFESCYRLENPVLRVRRDGEDITVNLTKKRNTSPGFITLYDIDPNVVQNIRTVVTRYKASKVLFLTSELAVNILKALFEVSELLFDYEVISAPNAFFGGTIQCAGLLTIKDIEDVLTEYLKTGMKPELILLPPVMFDHTGRDLLGRNIKELEQKFGISADTV